MQTSKENLITKFQNNLKSNVDNLEEIAKKDNWVFRYDKATDIFYFYPKEKQASADSVLLPTDKFCASVRINKDGFIEGIIIEDFLSLYVPENKEFKPLAKALKKKSGRDLDIGAYKIWSKALFLDSLSLAYAT